MEYIRIPLHGKYGEGKFTLVDGDYDGEYFSQYHWFLQPSGYVVRKAYANEGRGKSDIYLHKEVQNCKKGMVVDHINRDKLDNRGVNLRIITRRENTYNRTRKRNTKNRFKGVRRFTSTYTNKNGEKKFYQGKKFIAILKHKRIGSFETEEEAARAWDKEAYKIYGDLGVYNFIDIS